MVPRAVSDKGPQRPLSIGRDTLLLAGSCSPCGYFPSRPFLLQPSTSRPGLETTLLRGLEVGPLEVAAARPPQA